MCSCWSLVYSFGALIVFTPSIVVSRCAVLGRLLLEYLLPHWSLSAHVENRQVGWHLGHSHGLVFTLMFAFTARAARGALSRCLSKALWRLDGVAAAARCTAQGGVGQDGAALPIQGTRTSRRRSCSGGRTETLPPIHVLPAKRARMRPCCLFKGPVELRSSRSRRNDKVAAATIEERMEPHTSSRAEQHTAQPGPRLTTRTWSCLMLGECCEGTVLSPGALMGLGLVTLQ